MFEMLKNLNPFKKKSSELSDSSQAYSPQAYLSSQVASQPPYQPYPAQSSLAPQPAQPYQPLQPYPTQYPMPPAPTPTAVQRESEDSIKAKLNLVLAEIDTLKTQLQILNEKLSFIEGYYRQAQYRR